MNTRTKGALLGVSAATIIALVHAAMSTSPELPRFLFGSSASFEHRVLWWFIQALPFSIFGGIIVGTVLEEPPVDEFARVLGTVVSGVLICLITLVAAPCSFMSCDALGIYIVLIASLHVQALRVWRDA